MEPYQGRVLATRFGTMELDGPPWRIAQTDSLRRILIGAPIAITFEAGPPPSGLAPIVSIYDTRAREAMLLGADREDVVYRYRMKAESLRLDRPDFRVEGLLKDVRPGSVVQLEIISDRRRHCVTLDGVQHCQRGITVGDTWSLLMFPDGWSAVVRTLMSLAWPTGAFVLVGVLAAHARPAAVVALASVALLVVMPLALGFVMTPPLQLGAVLVGIAVGHALRRIIARRWPQAGPDEVVRRPE
jgi:hypothetical protein